MTEMIEVPIKELEKLEADRGRLYEFIMARAEMDSVLMMEFIEITGQIWKVANTRKWDINIVNEVINHDDIPKNYIDI